MNSKIDRSLDVSKSPPAHSSAMPSRVRRSFVVCFYLLIAAIIYLIIVMILPETGVFSRACIESFDCSRGEKQLKTAVVVAWLVSSIACVVLGWMGKLGARKQS
jgi:hypothetical protein